MASQLEDFGVDAVNPVAAAQMLAVLLALDNDSLDDIAPMLLPDGVVVESAIDNTSWPPNWCIIKAGPHDWVIVLAGTTSTWGQFPFHISGVFSTEEEGGAKVNGQWRDVALPILARMLALSSWGAPIKWRLAGHSYGGAVAQILAEELKRKSSLMTVHTLTMGAPKAREHGYRGPRPDVEWRLNSSADGIPALPYAGLYPTVSMAPKDLLPGIHYVGWAHYGKEAILYPGGTIDVESWRESPTPPGISVEGPAAHYELNYWGRLRQYAEIHTGSAAFYQALDISAHILDQPLSLLIPPALPMGITMPSGVVVPNPYPFAPNLYPGGPALSQLGAPRMALYNGPSIVRSQLFFSTNDPAGWCEGLILGRATAYNPPDLQPMLAAWIAARKKVLVQDATVQFARTSGVNPKGRSRSWHNIPPIGTGPGGFAGARAISDVELWLDVFADQGRIKGRINLRGLPIALTQMLPGTSTRLPFGPGTVATLIAAYTAMFIGGQNRGPSSGWQLLVKSSRANEPTAVKIPIAVYMYQNNRLTIDVIGGISGAVVGSVVVLAHNAQRCISGLSGTTTILKVDTAAPVPVGMTRYELDRGYCCGTDALVDARGSVRLKQTNYWQAEEILYGGFATKKTGRPSGARSGRQKSRCC